MCCIWSWLIKLRFSLWFYIFTQIYNLRFTHHFSIVEIWFRLAMIGTLSSEKNSMWFYVFSKKWRKNWNKVRKSLNFDVFGWKKWKFWRFLNLSKNSIFVFMIFCKFIKSKNVIFGKSKKRQNFNFFWKEVWISSNFAHFHSFFSFFFSKKLGSKHSKSAAPLSPEEYEKLSKRLTEEEKRRDVHAWFHHGYSRHF